jgi:dTDP-4-dehydrorhamnose 3,5-epimerase
MESPVHADERGFAREWFTETAMADRRVAFHVQQANLSYSVRNTIRGLHYSLAPQGQAKIVTCANGTFDDALVDVRVGSPTFGWAEIVTLREGDGRSVYLPQGVAHGFCVTSETATIVYLLSSVYQPDQEYGVDPRDPALAVPWDLNGKPVLSAKDAEAPSLAVRLEQGLLPTYFGVDPSE